MQQSYQVNLEAFQGPLDLLLFLIQKKKIDIHDIPIASITSEYLAYLDQEENINLEREAEFLLMAALLIYIKSQMLLPREEIIEEEDPRRPLVDRLLEYQKIKAVCSLLKVKEDQELKIWSRMKRPPVPHDDEVVLSEVSVFDLAETFFTILKKREQDDIRIISVQDISIEDKMNEILDRLKKDSFLDFMDFFSRQNSMQEALMAFFCLLELIKNRIAVAVQENLFQPIQVWLRRDKPA
jgi:segregation and condensation protein A